MTITSIDIDTDRGTTGSSATRSLTYIEGSFEFPDGARIAYARRGFHTGGALVFVHGWPDSWKSFKPVMDRLPHGLSVLSVSLPGFGGSDPLGPAPTPSDFAISVARLLDGLGVAGAVLVGHSLGTLVCQRLAEQRPDLVRGLVLIGAFENMPEDVGDELVGLVASLTDPIDEAFVREFQASTLATPVPDERFEMLVAESLRAPAQAWRGAAAGMRADRGHDPSGITAPSLLLWGDQDQLASREQQDRLLASLGQVRLVVYRGAGHSPNWEQPARVADDIATFVLSLDV